MLGGHILHGSELLDRIRPTVFPLSKGAFGLIEKEFRRATWELMDHVTSPNASERKISDGFAYVEFILELLEEVVDKELFVFNAAQMLHLIPRRA